MTDNTAEEQIPWHFYNTKSLEDAQELSKVTDLNDLQRRAVSRKGFVTRAINRIENDKNYFEAIKVQGKQSHARFEESRNFLEVRMVMVVNVYQRILLVVPLDKQTFMKEFDAIAKTYYEAMNVIDALLDSTDTKSKQDSAGVNNAGSFKGLSKGTLDQLKPDTITEQSLPQTFYDFNERLQIYMNANGILKLGLDEQRQIARSFLSAQLWNLIRDKITPTMPVFMDKTDARYKAGEDNSLMDLLEHEFRR